MHSLPFAFLSTQMCFGSARSKLMCNPIQMHFDNMNKYIQQIGQIQLVPEQINITKCTVISFGEKFSKCV